MTKRRANHISTFGSQLTSIISVTLVLIILGVLAVIGAAGHSGADILKSNIGFIIKVERDAPETEINRLKRMLNDAPYVSSYIFSSAEDILATESQYLGEDIANILDVNPYGAEFDIKVSSPYANVDSIEALSATLASDNAIENILTETAVIAAINDTMSRVSWILLCVASILLIISIVLIYNTVHLAIYSRRFVIHTMKLVGATGGFIRKPFIKAGIINGLIAGIAASILLIPALSYASDIDPLMALCFSPELSIAVSVVLIICGVTICGLASTLATNRYLRADYDDMFMK